MERVPMLAFRKEQRAANRFFWARGLSTAEIHNEMQPVYGDKCFNLSAAKSWCRQFSSSSVDWTAAKLVSGIKKLVPCWDKCLNVLGGYVEKWKLLVNAGFTYCLIWKLLLSNIPFVGPMHFLFALCENYAILNVVVTELSEHVWNWISYKTYISDL